MHLLVFAISKEPFLSSLKGEQVALHSLGPNCSLFLALLMRSTFDLTLFLVLVIETKLHLLKGLEEIVVKEEAITKGHLRISRVNYLHSNMKLRSICDGISIA